jgi:hypothetical protein
VCADADGHSGRARRLLQTHAARGRPRRSHVVAGTRRPRARQVLHRPQGPVAASPFASCQPLAAPAAEDPLRRATQSLPPEGPVVTHRVMAGRFGCGTPLASPRRNTRRTTDHVNSRLPSLDATRHEHRQPTDEPSRRCCALPSPGRRRAQSLQARRVMPGRHSRMRAPQVLPSAAGARGRVCSADSDPPSTRRDVDTHRVRPRQACRIRAS